jgi:hypothetical protein
MTDSPCPIDLRPPSDDLGALAQVLRAAGRAEVTIHIEPGRSLSTPELQLLLAAAQDPDGPSRLRLFPSSDLLAPALRLLGLEGRLEVAA